MFLEAGVQVAETFTKLTELDTDLWKHVVLHKTVFDSSSFLHSQSVSGRRAYDNCTEFVWHVKAISGYLFPTYLQ